eukprot:TRINITY_DN3258_c0_g1_i1.p1 TRINITY_DN3258_c0_g1~~TRINITY_DN3258_c0_g1_i1.p1  ORF type:complete len:269 (-),score=68.26 TRINITY_DN3258_c0_g1_i1:94-900(-)
MIADGDIYCANAGDTEVVMARKAALGSKFNPVLLSEQHRPVVPAERQRIKDQGGMVCRDRIFGDLSVSRGFGDPAYKRPITAKDIVSAEPFIQQRALVPETDQFIIIGCDGLWDKINYKQAVDFVVSKRKEGIEDPKKLSSLLTEEALRKGSSDNVTVVVVLIGWVAVEPSNRIKRQSIRAVSYSVQSGSQELSNLHHREQLMQSHSYSARDCKSLLQSYDGGNPLANRVAFVRDSASHANEADDTSANRESSVGFMEIDQDKSRSER